MTKKVVAVVGAGPGGLAAAAVLKRRGFHPVVFERGTIGHFWRGQYDRLHLHTIRWLSNLPGFHFPKSEGKWVSRDGVVAHLERYVAHFGLDVRTGVEVRRVDCAADGWRLDTSAGPFDAWAVVVATGYNRVPIEPKWPGQDQFPGEIILGANYKNPAPYRGRDVLVVGIGNTGAEISADLVEGGAGKVWISYRTPPNLTVRDGPIPPPLVGILLRYLGATAKFGDRLMAFGQRMDGLDDLSEYGLPPAPRGMVTQMIRDDAIPVIDVGMIPFLKQRRIVPVPAIARIEGKEFVLVDGRRIAPSAVIVCIGYRRGLEPLVGHLGVLNERGKPVTYGGKAPPTTPRLYFVGYKNHISGMFREFGYEAKQIARALKHA
ncbi:MAG TPA: NAD(P)/FAD-dependent oxidoreductase [Bauldia sp.]|nr:NAD(P)/FAD-dependent oxidoreductase [Bauldia sp.]